jgi:hypothetical protein
MKHFISFPAGYLLLEKAREVGALEAEQFGGFRLVPVTATHGF